ncbi:ATP-grasp domain-containing protein [Mycobacterium sp. ML4]
MKLARPDTFHPRIVLAGGPRRASGDDAGLVAALRTRGLHARWLPWDDPEVGDAHLVILRDAGPWAARLDEFLEWTTSVQNLLNPPQVIAWNADRRYLDQLAQRGVPTVPGQRWRPGEPIRLPSDAQVYVGAVVGSGTRRFTDRLDAEAYIAGAGRSVYVQSDPAPETVLVFIGGTPSHAFTMQDGGLHRGEADFELWHVGAAALAAAPGRLLYARAHLCGSRLLELQLVDPSLGWLRLEAETRGLAQREFALAVESALERLGLGPFSHRRP